MIYLHGSMSVLVYLFLGRFTSIVLEVLVSRECSEGLSFWNKYNFCIQFVCLYLKQCPPGTGCKILSSSRLG